MLASKRLHPRRQWILRCSIFTEVPDPPFFSRSDAHVHEVDVWASLIFPPESAPFASLHPMSFCGAALPHWSIFAMIWSQTWSTFTVAPLTLTAAYPKLLVNTEEIVFFVSRMSCQLKMKPIQSLSFSHATLSFCHICDAISDFSIEQWRCHFLPSSLLRKSSPHNPSRTS